jgi:hypothetical protein
MVHNPDGIFKIPLSKPETRKNESIKSKMTILPPVNFENDDGWEDLEREKQK